jgi:RNA polymerase sigma-70 factor, ECF subfamily
MSTFNQAIHVAVNERSEKQNQTFYQFDRSTCPAMEERAVVARVLRGEANAFEVLLTPCLAPARRLALRILRNIEDAEEVVQVAALKAYSHLAMFRGDARFATWFHQIARNEIYQELRKNNQRDRRFIAVVEKEGIDPWSQWRDCGPSQLEMLERNEVARGLELLIGYLPERLRQAFLLNCVEGLSIRETAKRMALSDAAVKSRVFRARQFIRTRESRPRNRVPCGCQTA